jgi:hypothetical protein
MKAVGATTAVAAVAGAAFGVPNPRLVLAAVAAGRAATLGIKFWEARAQAAKRGHGAVVLDIQQRGAESRISSCPGEAPPEAGGDDVKPWAKVVRIQDGRLVTATHTARPHASLSRHLP